MINITKDNNSDQGLESDEIFDIFKPIDKPKHSKL